MKSEFIITKNNKSFVLYAGLLDEATARGLKSVITSIAQIPTRDNEQTAIVQATVVMMGADGVERVYTGIGDASPRNVAPAMVNCLLRLAETRAKARALRDAINVAMCSLEELGPDAQDQPQQQPRQESRPVRMMPIAAAPSPKTEGCTCRSTGKYHALNCPARTAQAA